MRSAARVAWFPCLCLVLLLSACQGWPSGPIKYKPATPVPTRTPRVQTATPLVLSPTPVIIPPGSETPTLAADTETPTVTAPPETATNTPTQAASTLAVVILGCDTGVDILHGMGEVTNAYVTIRNSTSADYSNVCATLRGLDEGRPHPDKTKCVPSLPKGYRVTVKLTVDTTYREDTPIQVDVQPGDAPLLRVGEPACTAIGLALPDVGELGVPRPLP